MGPKFRMGTYVREVFDEMWKENRGCFMNKALSVRTGRGWIACESFPHTSHVNLYGKWTNQRSKLVGDAREPIRCHTHNGPRDHRKTDASYPFGNEMGHCFFRSISLSS